MKKSQLRVLFSFLIMTLVMLSCENNLEMILPQGPQGEQGEKGDKGDPGKSAFELWIEYFGKDPNTSIEDFFNSMKGKDGKDGAVPVIGDNGNWIIDGYDTGIPARGKDGKDGKDGVTPEIGDNGNWFIDGRDTGVPARGRDGFTPVIGDNGNWFINGEDTGKPSRGDDGKTPTVAIGPGPNYYWVIDGVVTNISAKGENGRDGNDGEDGFTPVIGEGGTWWIGGEDTGKPSVIIPEIGPGPNYNWFIDGVDTGKPSRGEDGVAGVDGKSAYELWKEAVELCDGTVKDKAGELWSCERDSWEDFLEWLQGGNVSTLHQHWIKLPGNEGKTIEQFIEELFDCHCDGIKISRQFEDECVELTSAGALAKDYFATFRVTGNAGTTVKVTGDGIADILGDITDSQTPFVFTVKRGDADILLSIYCAENGNEVTKNSTVPALKYIKLDGAATVTPVDGQESSTAVVNFATAPKEVYIDDVLIYDGGLTQAGTDTGWAVSNEGRTFTKTYARAANVQRPKVQAKGAEVDGVAPCSIIENAFEIPQLSPVTLGTPEFARIDGDECNLQLTVTGTEGMTVTASYPGAVADEIEIKTMTEAPAGTYTMLELPRKFAAYTVTVKAEKEGHGTVEKDIIIPAQINVTSLGFTNGNGSTPFNNDIVTNIFKNNFSVNITLVFKSRTGGTSNAVRRDSPSHGPYEFSVDIPAGEEAEVKFYRDYTTTLSSGNYTVNYEIVTECGAVSGNRTLRIDNQQDYQVGFSRPGGIPGWGEPGNPGHPDWEPSDDPTKTITFDVSLTNAIPNSWVEFALLNTDGVYQARFVAQVNASGNYSQSVTMSEKDFAAALDKNARFLFYEKNEGGQLSGQYNIASSKSMVLFSFD